MITFASNATGWDDTGDRMWPGGMTDTQITPITDRLDAAGQPWQVTRWPQPGTVNVYLATRSIYGENFVDGPRTVMMCHGIADKHYRTAFRGGMQRFAYVLVPGPAHAIRARGLPGLTVLGYPKLDPLIRGDIPRVAGGDRIRVLWAPTHGGGGEAHPVKQLTDTTRVAARRSTWWRRDELLTALDGFAVVEAPHPRHSPGHRATLTEYAAADVVIADGGSTLYEAMILGLPVVVCDWLTRDAITRRNTLEAQLYRSGALHHATSPQTLPATIEKAAADGPPAAAAAFAETVLPAALRGIGGALHAEFLTALAHDPVLKDREAKAMDTRSMHDPDGARTRADRVARRAAYLARRAGRSEPVAAAASSDQETSAAAGSSADTDAGSAAADGPSAAFAGGGSGRAGADQETSAAAGPEPGESGPDRPGHNDRVSVWRDYAVGRGLDVDGMTKAEIIAVVDAADAAG